jgi:hypothetical protein
LKRVDDPHAFDLAAVLQILRVDLLASKRAGGCDDRAIPIRKTMSRFDRECALDDCKRGFLNGKSPSRFR